MTNLLKSRHKHPVSEWERALAEAKDKLIGLKGQLETRQAKFNDMSLDVWFRENERPHIELLEKHIDNAERTVKAVESKLAEAKAARPAALEELKAAYAERDALAREIAETYPAMIVALADLAMRAAASERRILAVAAAGEGGIHSASPWDAARGHDTPMTVQGKAPAPRVVLCNLDGEPIYETPVSVTAEPDALPSRVVIANTADESIVLPNDFGVPIRIGAGETVTVPPFLNAVGRPNLSINLES